MSKKHIGDELIQAMREAIQYMRNQDNGCITHKIKVPIKEKIFYDQTISTFNQENQNQTDYLG